VSAQKIIIVRARGWQTVRRLRGSFAEHCFDQANCSPTLNARAAKKFLHCKIMLIAKRRHYGGASTLDVVS